MTTESNAKKYLSLLDINLENNKATHEDDFKVKYVLPRQGVFFEAYSSRFNSIKKLISHLESKINTTPNFDKEDKSYTFDLKNSDFSQLVAYKEKDSVKIWLEKSPKKIKP